MRIRESLESMSIFKNKINFTVRLDFNVSSSSFDLEVEALSLWTIDEINYYHFHSFWWTFMNSWFNLSHAQDDQLD
jgi:hypothetical protein